MTLGPVAHYLPHRPPMLLVDEIVDATDSAVVCRMTIRPDCIFVEDNRVHASAMIEVVAQACAIHGGLARAADRAAAAITTRGDVVAPAGDVVAPAGDVGRGMVVACREAHFAVDDFAIGDVLTIAVTRTQSQPPLTSFTGTVTRADVTCVTMQLSVVTEAA